MTTVAIDPDLESLDFYKLKVDQLARELADARRVAGDLAQSVAAEPIKELRLAINVAALSLLERQRIADTIYIVSPQLRRYLELMEKCAASYGLQDIVCGLFYGPPALPYRVITITARCKTSSVACSTVPPDSGRLD